jgi:hypothetical protein
LKFPILNWTLPLYRSRQDDRNTYIDRRIWTPNEEVRIILETCADLRSREPEVSVFVRKFRSESVVSVFHDVLGLSAGQHLRIL